MSPFKITAPIFLIPLIFISAMFLATLLWRIFLTDKLVDGIGYSDSIQYWTAHALAATGSNPYDAAKIQEHQSIIRPSKSATFMWNPPWLIAVLAPVLKIESYLLFNRAWISISIFLYCLSSFLITYSSSSARRDYITLGLILISYPPFLQALSCSQLGAWLLLGVTLTILGLQAKSLWLVAAGFLFLSFKPHLFAIWVGTMLFFHLKRRDFWIVGSGVICLILALGSTSLIFGFSLIENWLIALTNRDSLSLTPHATEWASTSLPSVVSNLLGIKSTLAVNICKIFFFIGGLFLAIKLSKHHGAHSFYPEALVVSLIFSPMTWLFDYICLAPIVIYTWCNSVPNSKFQINFLTTLVILSISTFFIIKRLDQAFLPILLMSAVLLQELFTNKPKDFVNNTNSSS